ncbi:MAG: hypothetical protein ABJN57_06790 [Hyphomicrobiales bacterium]
MFVTRIRWAISLIKSITLALTVLLLAVSVSSIQPASAKPLAKKECKTLKSKIKTLKATPAVMNMSKGFEWVKENMKGDDLLPIKEFIETEEQYKFRCPQPRKKKAPKPKKADPKKDLVDKKAKSKAKPEKKVQKTKPKKKKKNKKSTTKKKPVKKKKKKSSLEPTKKPEPTLFETIFPSSVENKEKS